MNNVNGVQPPWAPKPVEPTNAAAASPPANLAGGVSDVVEISTAASLTAKIQQIPEVRAELIARVKGEIEAGTYETPERIEIAIDRLLEDLYPELL